MADYSAKLKKYLNDNYCSYSENADGEKIYHCVFNKEYFVKCLVTETVDRDSKKVIKTENYYILERADETTGKLSHFVPDRAFTADEIKKIIGTAEYNEFGIIE